MLKIWGYSDDVVEFKSPHVMGSVGCFIRDVVFLVKEGDRGVAIRMTYDGGMTHGCWSAEIAPLDEFMFMPPVSISLGEEPISPTVHVDVGPEATIEWKRVRDTDRAVIKDRTFHPDIEWEPPPPAFPGVPRATEE